MKKFELLKVVVIVQALCMITLAGFVIIKLWPVQPTDSGEHIEPVPQDEVDGNAEHKQRIIASVGGESIYYEDLIRNIYELHGDSALRTLMVHKALELEANLHKIEVSEAEIDEELGRWMSGYDSEQEFYAVMKEQLGMSKTFVYEEARYRVLMDKIIIVKADISQADITKYIDQHPELFEPTQQLHLRWIVTDTREKADHVLSILEEGQSFAELAAEYSIDAFTSSSGGDLGNIDVNDPFYDADLLQKAAKLIPSQIIGPIETEGDFAIVQLLGKVTTDRMSWSKQQAEAQRLLALERSKPQLQVEDELLQKHNALIMK